MNDDVIATLMWLTPFVLIMWVLFSVAAAAPVGNMDIAVELQQRNHRVIDGDTFELNGERIRLHGVDAPEKGQPCILKDGSYVDCAGTATDALLAMFDGGSSLECTHISKSYGRLVMICFIDGEDIGKHMVASGLAFHDSRYSKGLYKGQLYAAEFVARFRGLGVWRDGLGVEYPWVWRKRNK